MKIGTHDIGYGKPTFVIAEACSNITRYLDDLKIFIETVAKTGADGLKCQLYLPEHFPEAERSSKYQTMFPRPLFKDYVTISHEHGLLCGASVFDYEAIDLCVDCGADYLKLATREEKDTELFEVCVYTGLPIIRSYDWSSGVFQASDSVLMMACIPQYPAINPSIPSEMQITDAISSLWGWSSHSIDCLDCLLAVSRGACVIEKHFKMSNVDYESGWSLDPIQFAQMIGDIRRVEVMR